MCAGFSLDDRWITSNAFHRHNSQQTLAPHPTPYKLVSSKFVILLPIYSPNRHSYYDIDS
jgi:hypothetical protein